MKKLILTTVILMMTPLIALAVLNFEESVMETLLESEYASDYSFGDDGEDCYSDYEIESWEEVQNLIKVRYQIYHQGRFGCYYHNTVACHGTFDRTTGKAIAGGCEVL